MVKSIPSVRPSGLNPKWCGVRREEQHARCSTADAGSDEVTT
jgi:hypothetical protein